MKAVRYHEAKFEPLYARLVEVLSAYEPTESAGDGAICDDVGGTSQAELFAEARADLERLRVSVNSIPELLSRIPLVGRTLTIEPPGAGIEMNPWLVRVVAMPAPIRHTTTHHLLQGCVNVLGLAVDGGEKPGLPFAAELEFRLEAGDPFHAVYRELPGRFDGAAWLGEAEAGAGAPPRAKADGAWIPEGTINCLLLQPAAPLRHGAAPGTLIMGTTFLLTRNPKLFLPDAYMALQGAVVYHLLERPADPAERAAELGAIREAFHQVYPEGSKLAGGMHEYVAKLGTRDFRECLATELDGRDASKPLRCPHLTKFVLGLFLMATGGEAGRAAFAKRFWRYQTGLLIELFHRAGLERAEYECSLATTHEAWVAKHLELPCGRLNHFGTFRDASRALRPGFEALVRKVDLGDVGFTGRIAPPSHEKIASARYYQVSAGSIKRVFGALAEVAGVADRMPSPTPNTLALLPRLLRIAQIKDNAERCRAPQYCEPVGAEELQAWAAGPIMAKFRRDALDLFDIHLERFYARAVVSAHLGVAPAFPREFLDRFQAEHGTDLREALCVTPAGLSGVACSCPGCPLYLQVLGAPTKGRNGWGLSPWLKEHLRPIAVIPGLHKTMGELRNTKGADIYARMGPADVQVLAPMLAKMVAGGQSLDQEAFGDAKPAKKDRARTLAQRVGDALDINSADEPPMEWLAKHIEQTMRAEKAWAYEDFAAAMVRAGFGA